jgi:hypothetical protein
MLFGIFSIGSLFRTADKTDNFATPKYLNNAPQKNDLPNRKRTDQSAEVPNNQTQQGNLNVTPDVQTQTNDQNAVVGNQSTGQKKQAELLQSRQNEKKEPVYFCGAETKKGTPCSRRVKGGGRCWQHEGKVAMLPDKQLSISQ